MLLVVVRYWLWLNSVFLIIFICLLLLMVNLSFVFIFNCFELFKSIKLQNVPNISYWIWILSFKGSIYTFIKRSICYNSVISWWACLVSNLRHFQNYKHIFFNYMKLMKSWINLELEVNLEKFSKENLIFYGKVATTNKNADCWKMSRKNFFTLYDCWCFMLLAERIEVKTVLFSRWIKAN